MSYDELFKVRFDDLGKIITGKTPSTKVNQYWDGKIQFITPKDIQVNKYVNETDRYITEEGLKAINNILLGKGAVAVSCIGNIGYVGKIIHKAVTNQQLNAIVPNQYYDSDYVYYLMKNSWSLFKSLENQSTTVSIINKSQFSSLEVSVFKEKKKQKAIANILTSLDGKIELNNKINKNLEELAQTLYKRWFVDFEFPNEDGEPYKSSGGEMVDSELGLIPKGWEISNLLDIADYLNGLAVKKFAANDDELSLPVLKIKELGIGNVTAESDRCNLSVPEKYIIKKGDLIFSWSGTLLVDFWTGSKSVLNQHLFKVSSTKYPRWFYYFWTKYHLGKFQNIAKSMATTMGHIKREDLSKSQVFIPIKDLLEQGSSIFEPIIDQILKLRIQNNKLMKVRDELLPKLMNGEIEVPIEE